jgi:hypothetical protein
MVSVGLDLRVRHSRFDSGAWSRAQLTGQLTFLQPMIVAAEAGAPHLLVTGVDSAGKHSLPQAILTEP